MRTLNLRQSKESPYCGAAVPEVQADNRFATSSAQWLTAFLHRPTATGKPVVTNRHQSLIYRQCEYLPDTESVTLASACAPRRTGTSSRQILEIGQHMRCGTIIEMLRSTGVAASASTIAISTVMTPGLVG